MKRIKCKYCGSKPRKEFAVKYRGIEMCHDCSCEYSKIFDGTKSRKERKAEENPLFNSFERGWRLEEMQQGLPHMEIPQFMKDDYARMWEIEKTRWNEASIDRRFRIGEFWSSKDRCQLAYEELMRKFKEQDGISENQ